LKKSLNLRKKTIFVVLPDFRHHEIFVQNPDEIGPKKIFLNQKIKFLIGYRISSFSILHSANADRNEIN